MSLDANTPFLAIPAWRCFTMELKICTMSCKLINCNLLATGGAQSPTNPSADGLKCEAAPPDIAFWLFGRVSSSYCCTLEVYNFFSWRSDLFSRHDNVNRMNWSMRNRQIQAALLLTVFSVVWAIAMLPHTEVPVQSRLNWFLWSNQFFTAGTLSKGSYHSRLQMHRGRLSP